MKILVRVWVPAIMREFDVQLPDTMGVSDTVQLLAEAVVENTNHEYHSSGQEVLCLKRMNAVLDGENSLKQYRVRNGDTLVLI